MADEKAPDPGRAEAVEPKNVDREGYGELEPSMRLSESGNLDSAREVEKSSGEAAPGEFGNLEILAGPDTYRVEPVSDKPEASQESAHDRLVRLDQEKRIGYMTEGFSPAATDVHRLVVPELALDALKRGDSLALAALVRAAGESGAPARDGMTESIARVFKDHGLAARFEPGEDGKLNMRISGSTGDLRISPAGVTSGDAFLSIRQEAWEEARRSQLGPEGENRLHELFLEFRRASGNRPLEHIDAFNHLVRMHAYSPVHNQALSEIVDAIKTSGSGEGKGRAFSLGAGTGYLEHLINEKNGKGEIIDAFDLHPVESGRNRFYPQGGRSWSDVHSGSEYTAASHPDQTLLLSWPPYNEPFGARALTEYLAAGDASPELAASQKVVVVSPGSGGNSGDHAMWEILSREFDLKRTIELDHWYDRGDTAVRIYERKPHPEAKPDTGTGAVARPAEPVAGRSYLVAGDQAIAPGSGVVLGEGDVRVPVTAGAYVDGARSLPGADGSTAIIYRDELGRSRLLALSGSRVIVDGDPVPGDVEVDLSGKKEIKIGNAPPLSLTTMDGGALGSELTVLDGMRRDLPLRNNQQVVFGDASAPDVGSVQGRLDDGRVFIFRNQLDHGDDIRAPEQLIRGAQEMVRTNGGVLPEKAEFAGLLDLSAMMNGRDASMGYRHLLDPRTGTVYSLSVEERAGAESTIDMRVDPYHAVVPADSVLIPRGTAITTSAGVDRHGRSGFHRDRVSSDPLEHGRAALQSPGEEPALEPVKSTKIKIPTSTVTIDGVERAPETETAAFRERLAAGVEAINESRFEKGYDSLRETGNFPGQVDFVRSETVLKAGDLTAGGLATYLEGLKHPSVSRSGERYIVSEPVTIVELPSGVRVDIMHPERTVDGDRVQAAADLEFIDGPQTRALQKRHAVLMAASLAEAHQQHWQGKLISPSLAEHLENNGNQVRVYSPFAKGDPQYRPAIDLTGLTLNDGFDREMLAMEARNVIFGNETLFLLNEAGLSTRDLRESLSSSGDILRREGLLAMRSMEKDSIRALPYGLLPDGLVRSIESANREIKAMVLPLRRNSRSRPGSEIASDISERAASRAIEALKREGIPRRLGIPPELLTTDNIKFASLNDCEGKYVLETGVVYVGVDAETPMRTLLHELGHQTAHLDLMAAARVDPEGVRHALMSRFIQDSRSRHQIESPEARLAFERMLGDRIAGTSPADHVDTALLSEFGGSKEALDQALSAEKARFDRQLALIDSSKLEGPSQKIVEQREAIFKALKAGGTLRDHPLVLRHFKSLDVDLRARSGDNNAYAFSSDELRARKPDAALRARAIQRALREDSLSRETEQRMRQDFNKLADYLTVASWQQQFNQALLKGDSEAAGKLARKIVGSMSDNIEQGKDVIGHLVETGILTETDLKGTSLEGFSTREGRARAIGLERLRQSTGDVFLIGSKLLNARDDPGSFEHLLKDAPSVEMAGRQVTLLSIIENKESHDLSLRVLDQSGTTRLAAITDLWPGDFEADFARNEPRGAGAPVEARVTTLAEFAHLLAAEQSGQATGPPRIDDASSRSRLESISSRAGSSEPRFERRTAYSISVGGESIDVLPAGRIKSMGSSSYNDLKLASGNFSVGADEHGLFLRKEVGYSELSIDGVDSQAWQRESAGYKLYIEPGQKVVLNGRMELGIESFEIPDFARAGGSGSNSPLLAPAADVSVSPATRQSLELRGAGYIPGEKPLVPGMRFTELHEDRDTGVEVERVPIVVDPANDPVLKAVLDEASARFGSIEDPHLKMKLITRFAHDLLTPENATPPPGWKPEHEGQRFSADDAMYHMDREFRGKSLYLGEYVRRGVGTCVPQSLLVKAMGDRLGLPVGFQTGMFGAEPDGSFEGQRHAWNTLSTEEGRELHFDPRYREYDGKLAGELEQSGYRIRRDSPLKQRIDALPDESLRTTLEEIRKLSTGNPELEPFLADILKLKERGIELPSSLEPYLRNSENIARIEGRLSVLRGSLERTLAGAGLESSAVAEHSRAQPAVTGERHDGLAASSERPGAHESFVVEYIPGPDGTVTTRTVRLADVSSEKLSEELARLEPAELKKRIETARTELERLKGSGDERSAQQARERLEGLEWLSELKGRYDSAGGAGERMALCEATRHSVRSKTAELLGKTGLVTGLLLLFNAFAPEVKSAERRSERVLPSGN